MPEWLTNASPVEWILLAVGVAHTLIRVGEWKRARERVDEPPRPHDEDCVTREELATVLREERHNLRDEVNGKLLHCVSLERYTADQTQAERRLDRLEVRVWGKRS